MTEDSDKRCFRCRGIYKVMMNMRIDNEPICLCVSCYRDFGLFLEGYVVNPLVRYEDKREAEQ